MEFRADVTTRLLMRGIGKRFGATVALEDVDFSVRAGEVHALVGENGAGKSTLVKILSGALQADAGTVLLDGMDYRPGNPIQARRQGVSTIYQELSLAPHLSVAENILLGVEPTRWGILDQPSTGRGPRDSGTRGRRQNGDAASLLRARPDPQRPDPGRRGRGPGVTRPQACPGNGAAQ